MNILETGALGWQHEAWNNSYYPEDLPEDWRLDYYSHHFNFVVIKEHEWRNVARGDVDQWLDDVDDSFFFYLSVDTGGLDAGVLDQLRLIEAGLGERLSGILLTGVMQGVADVLATELTRLATVYTDMADGSVPAGDMKGCWRPGSGISGARLGILPAESAMDMRGMRACIQEFLAQRGESGELGLIFEGEPPPVKAMQDAQVIIEMLT